MSGKTIAACVSVQSIGKTNGAGTLPSPPPHDDRGMLPIQSIGEINLAGNLLSPPPRERQDDRGMLPVQSIGKINGAGNLLSRATHVLIRASGPRYK